MKEFKNDERIDGKECPDTEPNGAERDRADPAVMRPPIARAPCVPSPITETAHTM